MTSLKKKERKEKEQGQQDDRKRESQLVADLWAVVSRRALGERDIRVLGVAQKLPPSQTRGHSGW